MSLAESGHNNVSRYGERRRYRSGQSDSSVNTNSTTHTNHSAPIITNRKSLLFPYHTPFFQMGAKFCRLL